MAIKGIFTSDAGGLGERETALSSTILKAERGQRAMTFALSSGMMNTDTDQTAVTWYEEGLMHSRVAITNMVNPTGNAIGVQDASWMTENMVLLVEATGEYVFVLGITGNTLSVQRAIGGTPLTPIVLGGDEIALQLVGVSFEEGSERPIGVTTSPYPRSNITQIFRHAWDITGTAEAVTYRHGNRVERNKAVAGTAHAESIERSLIWGKMHHGVVNNKPQRMMDGIISQLRTNFTVAPPGGLTRRPLTDFIERVMSRNIEGQPNERLFFCGNTAVRALQEIAYSSSEYQISVSEQAFGINVQKFICPWGTISLLIHPLMNESPVWTNQIYALHPGAMEMSWLRRTSKSEEGTGGSASDLRDARSGTITSELTCKYKLEQTGGVLMDISVKHAANA